MLETTLATFTLIIITMKNLISLLNCKLTIAFRTVLVTVFLILPFLSQAQKPRTVLPFEIQVNEEEAWEVKNGIKISKETDMPLSLYDLTTALTPAPPEVMGLEFLSLFSGQLGLREDELGQLRMRAHRTSDAGTTVRYWQTYQSIPVYNSEVTVNIDNNHQGRLILNGWKYNLPVIDPTPQIPLETAKSLAYEHIQVEGRIQFDETKLWIYPHGTPRLAWQIRVEAAAPLGSWEVMVDAHSGEIVKAVDRSAYYHHGDSHGPGTDEECETPEIPLPIYILAPPPATGTGLVFDTDPLTTATTTYGGNYADNGDASNASLVAEQQSVSLLDITFSGGQHQLIGPFAEIQDFENPFRGLFSQASSVFNFNRQQNNFEAVNVYYHIDQSMRYLNVTLGCNLMPYQYNTGVRFDPSGLNGADNSHYLGGSGRLAFGDGGVDDAEDADVILHELGHGLHDWATVGGLSQVNGLSEGSGDYWANSYKRGLGHWTTADQQYFWVFGWDGHNPFWNGRVTNYGPTYPGGLVGQIHTDGQIWSTCCLQIWEIIGQARMDKAFWEGLALTNGSSSQQDAAIAVRTAAINMNYTVAEITTIHNIFAGCGYNMGVLPVLPIDMVDFTGNRSGINVINLDWLVASEVGFEGFEVERRAPGENDFSYIGHVPVNVASKKDFSFQDTHAPSGRVAYRIKQKDQDGGSQYSKVIEIEGIPATGGGLVTFPNPTSGMLHLLIEREDLQVAEAFIEIHDLQGRFVIQKQTEVQGNPVVLELPETEQLEPGMYLVKVTCGGMISRGTFTKTK